MGVDTGKNILKNKGESDRKENLINIVTSAILRKSLPTHQTKGSNHKRNGSIFYQQTKVLN